MAIHLQLVVRAHAAGSRLLLNAAACLQASAASAAASSGNAAAASSAASTAGAATCLAFDHQMMMEKRISQWANIHDRGMVCKKHRSAGLEHLCLNNCGIRLMSAMASALLLVLVHLLKESPQLT